jgi:hypothetical protein
MIHEVHLGRACDSLRQQLEEEITLGVNAQVKADSVIEVQRRQIALRDQAVKVQGDRVMNYAKDNQELRKEVRRQKGLTLAVGVAAIIAIIIAL